jgi:hypothetical protein
LSNLRSPAPSVGDRLFSGMTTKTVTEETRISLTVLRAWAMVLALVSGTATGMASAVATGYALRDQERVRSDGQLQAAVANLRNEQAAALKYYVTREELLSLLGARFDQFEDRLMRRLDAKAGRQ